MGTSGSIWFVFFSFSFFSTKLSAEYLSVRGGFGDAWKDEVLSGEYKRVTNPSDYGMNRASILYVKRRKTEFQSFIRYDVDGNQWLFQDKQYLRSRTNYAHIKCSQKVQSFARCRVTSCQTYGTSSWLRCPGIQISGGGGQIEVKDATETRLYNRLKNDKNYPSIIQVSGKLGDKWKDGNIIGIYKLNRNINPPDSGGRPTYQKADKSNMYLNYYAPDHEWGFRNKLALGQRRSYTFLKPVMETFMPTQLGEVDFECQVYAQIGESGNYEWKTCTGKADGRPDITITSSEWPDFDNPVSNIRLVVPTTKPTTRSRRYFRRTTTTTTSSTTTLPTFTMDFGQRPQEKYHKVDFSSTYAEAKEFCETFGIQGYLADFNGMESDIDQRWLITYQPWSNVRKHNNRWYDGNNKNQPYNVIERYKWHACAYYENGHLVSEDCQFGRHTLVCEFPR